MTPVTPKATNLGSQENTAKSPFRFAAGLFSRVANLLTGSARARVALVVSCALAFALTFTYPVWLNLTRLSINNDWDFATQLHWVPYHTITSFHQFPLWNPYKCGGMAMYANPQSRILTPFFLLHLMFGPNVGAHLEVILHLAIMWLGTYVLGRVQKMSALASVFAATLFCANSWYFLHLGEGHNVFLGFAYLPWVAACVWRAISDRELKWAALGGLLIALMLGEGGVQAASLTLLEVGLIALFFALLTPSPWPIVVAAVVVVFMAGLAAVKLLPTYEMLSTHPKEIWGPTYVRWSEIYDYVFIRNIDRYPTDRGFVESGAFVSPMLMALAVPALLAPRRSMFVWLFGGVILVWLVRGDDGGSWPLYRYFHMLPVFSLQRLPSRILVCVMFNLGQLAGYGVDFLRVKLRAVGTTLVVVLLIAGAVDNWLVGPRVLRTMFEFPLTAIPRSTLFRQFDDETAFDQTAVAFANMGKIPCYDYTDWTINVKAYNQDGYRGEQYLLGPGSVRLTEWSPNRLGFQVIAKEPTVLVINQNYDRGWHLARGEGLIENNKGLLSVRIPPGEERITLVYRDYSILVGASASAVFVALLVALFRRKRY